jgi:AraC-like DNA-binding protein
MPFHGLILFTRDGAPLRVTSSGRTIESAAMAICARDLHFDESRNVVTIVVNPLHENFRLFSRLPEPGVLPLDRALFSTYDAVIEQALDGTLLHDDALELFDKTQAMIREYLPSAPKLDERARVLVKELWANPRCSVDDLAQRLGLSYHRTSHFFTESVGVAMRTYQLWQKLYRAGAPLLAGASLTEAAQAAGFVDSAHYSSAFQKAYGRPPSTMFRNPRVAIYSTNPVCSARERGAAVAADQ